MTSRDEVWDDQDPVAMGSAIRDSGMPLDAEDYRLVRRALESEPALWNVYDLHRLNVLMHQSLGYRRGKSDATRTAS